MSPENIRYMPYRFIIVVVCAVASLQSCKSPADDKSVPSTSNEVPYTVIESGIFVEKFPDGVTDENRYNLDNKVFLVGREFVYDYVYKTKDGLQLYFEGGRDGWNFADVDAQRDYVVKELIISVLPGLEPMIESIPDYNQTLLEYQCPPNTDFTISGVIENEKNIWMHPPREALFKITELNPFPFIQIPYEIGSSWEWSLDISSSWGDPRWMTWHGIVTNDYRYEIVSREPLTVSAGTYDCFKIEAVGTGQLGDTALTSYYNEEVGFVKLDYKNIDGSSLIFELQEIKEPKLL